MVLNKLVTNPGKGKMTAGAWRGHPPPRYSCHLDSVLLGQKQSTIHKQCSFSALMPSNKSQSNSAPQIKKLLQVAEIIYNESFLNSPGGSIWNRIEHILERTVNWRQGAPFPFFVKLKMSNMH